MSKTFASKPSQQSTRGRGRGRSTNPSSTSSTKKPNNLGLSDPGRTVSQTGAHDRSRRTGDTSVQTRGGALRGRSTVGLPSSRGSHSQSQDRRTMYHQYQQPGRAAAGGRGAGISQDQINSPSKSETSLEGRGQYAGGYTVFTPNERRRQQINQMAQKETREYERFKQSNSGQTFNYVGTLGGGEMGQDQVRNRQANAVRAQKFNRQMRQNEMRQEWRQKEEQEIETKRAQARQKAEQNKMREERAVPAEEVRRKREAFLQQIEATNNNNNNSSHEASAHMPQSSNKEHHFGQSSPTKTRQTQATSGSRPNNSSSRLSATQTASPKQETKSPDASRRCGEEHVVDHPQQYHHEEVASSSMAGLGILCNIFPNLDQDYVADLLLQMGSVDAVFELLNDE